jgi:serine/threonine protein kinase
MKSAFTVREDRVLGEAVLGTLHEGLESSTEQPVTITVLRHEFSGDPEFSRRFHREIGRASRIVHPNVVRTYGSGVWKGSLFYATEKVEGKELRGPRKGEKQLPSDEILKIAEGSARALIAAEKHKITPLHLRKEGIFITPKGSVKVAEIGLARILDNEAAYQRAFQFSPYLSPERTQGLKADVRSDIFALGVILYELATGKPPFEGHESKTSYLYQLLNVAPVPPRAANPRVSRELERVILRCLAKDPGRRYQSAGEILEEVLAVRRAPDRAHPAEDLSRDDSGDFEIDEDQIIGEGGMGTLFRGRQRSLDRAVAIKVIRNVRIANADFRKRFRREAELLAQVRDGNVVQIFGAGSWKGRPFFAMELVEGKDLRARVTQGPPLTVAEILHIGQGVGKALRAAWSHKIVHRDIKPSNILLARDGSIKVTDFGLATSLSLRRRDTRSIVGTLGYLSPEQGAGESVDIRSDIYSLGVVLFELASGTVPFGSSHGSPSAIMSKQAFVPPPTLSGTGKIPPAVDAVIQRCLARSPDHRFQTPDELLTEIQAVRQVLWAEARLPASVLPIARAWSDDPFPSPGGAYPRSVRETFDLAMAMGDHESALRLAKSEFGLPSKEYKDASAPSREAAFRESEKAALQRFMAEDWSGAAAAYREMMGRADAGRKEELVLAVAYCERLAVAQASGRMPLSPTGRRNAEPEPNDSSIGPRRPF